MPASLGYVIYRMLTRLPSRMVRRSPRSSASRSRNFADRSSRGTWVSRSCFARATTIAARCRCSALCQRVTIEVPRAAAAQKAILRRSSAICSTTHRQMAASPLGGPRTAVNCHSLGGNRSARLRAIGSVLGKRHCASVLPSSTDVRHDRIVVHAELSQSRMSTVPIRQHTIDGLLRRAAEYEGMAARATTMAAASSLRRLADRIRDMARERVAALTFRPGELAPVEGRYRQFNIFGSRTETAVHVQRGEPLPAAPRNFTWRLHEES